MALPVFLGSQQIKLWFRRIKALSGNMLFFL